MVAENGYYSVSTDSAIVLQLVFIEWIVGCGESYVDANGVRHWYECVFLNFNPEGDV